mgnify:CR=1 FL=1
MKFDELGINKEILEKITKKGFEKPTYIQERSIPEILAGKDVLGKSATGSGKTLAFGMGLMHNPQLLLFDEPFAGVDAKNSEVLNRLFNETVIQPKNMVIIVEHKDDAKQLFNRKIKMQLGKIKL